MTISKSKDEIKQAVREHYAKAITTSSGCCGTKPVNFSEEAAGKYVALAGYTEKEMQGLPEGVTTFGCGNPVNFAGVKPGQTVLDLGSGAGLDLILAARKVGPTGKVIGLDMTPEMIASAQRNLTQAGIKNFELVQGEMEKMPIPSTSVDWIISNCVINLSPDKPKVFAEAFRVLKSSGQVLVSDIVTNDLPDSYRNDITAWVGCLAGAVEEDEYLELMRKAGFEDVKIVEKQVYTPESLDTLANDYCGCGAKDREIDKSVIVKFGNRVASVKVSARKP
jgi:SAM-dependent methyltransferase